MAGEDNIPSPASTVISGHAISRVSTFTLHQNTLPLHCNKAGLPGDVLVQVNLTFIRPVLEYASPGVVYLKVSEELERI